MRKFLSVSGSIGMFVLCVSARAAEPDFRSEKALISALAEMFSKVTSLQYASTRDIEIHTESIDRKDFQRGSLSWRNSGDKFLYEIVPLSRNGNSMTVAYDGVHSQILEEKEGVLSLDPTKFKTLPGSLANDLFLPFSFFPAIEAEAAPFSDSPLSTVFNPEAWEVLLGRMKGVGMSSVADSPCFVVELPGPFWDGGGDPTVFRVYLSDSSAVKG